MKLKLLLPLMLILLVPLAYSAIPEPYWYFSMDNDQIETNSDATQNSTSKGGVGETVSFVGEGGFNNASSASGIINEGRFFDGTDDTWKLEGVTTLADDPSNETWTYNVWLNQSNVGTLNIVFDSGASSGSRRGHGIWTDSTNNLRVALNTENRGSGGSQEILASIDEDVYTMYTFIFYDNNGTVEVYRNATLAGSTTIAGSGIGSVGSSEIRIGWKILGGAGFAYKGLIDEMCIWNEELEPSNITELFNNGNGLICATPPPPAPTVFTTRVFIDDVHANLTTPKNATGFTVSFTGNGSITLLRNGTEISNNSLQELDAGQFNFTSRAEEDRSFFSRLFVNVQDVLGTSTSLFVNGVQSNLVLNEGETFDVFALGINGTPTITRNGEVIANNTNQTLVVGGFQFIATIVGDALTVGSTETWNVEVISLEQLPLEGVANTVGMIVFFLIIFFVIIGAFFSKGKFK